MIRIRIFSSREKLVFVRPKESGQNGEVDEGREKNFGPFFHRISGSELKHGQNYPWKTPRSNEGSFAAVDMVFSFVICPFVQFVSFSTHIWVSWDQSVRSSG